MFRGNYFAAIGPFLTDLALSRLTIDTKECLAKKQKPQALYKLKQRKRIEAVLEKRLHYLDAMDTILFKIESSQNDAQVK